MRTKEQLLFEVGQIFRFFRLRAKLNKNEMAKQMGVTYNAITRIEEGKDTNLSTFLLFLDRMKDIESKGLADNIHFIMQRVLKSGEYTKDDEAVEVYGIRPENKHLFEKVDDGYKVLERR